MKSKVAMFIYVAFALVSFLFGVKIKNIFSFSES